MTVNFVIPYLPKDAETASRAWMAGGKPAFVKAIQRSEIENGCMNCAGLGVVYVVFADKGPLKTPVPARYTPCTWFDGDGRYGKGWYVVDRTEGYTCPACLGKSKETGVYVERPKTAAEIKRLAELMR